VGTADDLVYADVVNQLVAAGITVFTIAYDPSPCASDAFTRVATATDGAYYRARQIDQVPQAVVDLIREAVDGADLTVAVDPDSYAGWVSVSPPVYYDVPALESRVFQVSLHAPFCTMERWHTFDLVALADGFEVGRVLVEMELDLSGCVCIPPPFSIAKTVDRSAAGLGETLTYVITVSNSDDEDMIGATVSDFFPAEVTWNGVITASSGVTTVVGNLLTWQVDVPAGGAVTIAYQATVNSPLPDGTLIVNTARLEGYGLWSSAVTVVLAPELHFSRKSASRLMVRPDDLITYTILVRNTGHADASNVLVTDTLPVSLLHCSLIHCSLFVALSPLPITPSPGTALSLSVSLLHCSLIHCSLFVAPCPRGP